MKFEFKNVLIYGYGISGKSVENKLIEMQINYKILDDKIGINGGKYLSKINKKNIQLFDLIIVSPGIKIIGNYIIKLCENYNIKYIGELEFGYCFFNTKIIAVTGTNGKTTTVNLINKMLGNSGLKSMVLGNVGVPLSSCSGTDLDYAVVEVSTNQIETLDKFTPYIGVLINITPDHLDRHNTMENYIKLKFELFKNCTNNSVAILNIDDSIIAKNEHIISCEKYYISATKKIKGVYINDNKTIVFNNGKIEIDLINLSDLISANINLYNILATLLTICLLNLTINNIKDVLLNFKENEHRCEFVNKIGSVRYINDSKATNVYATINALQFYKNDVILLLGGRNKNLKFDDIFEHINSVKYIVAFGECRYEILKCAKKNNYINIEVVKNLEDAVIKAKEKSISGDTILLSPACTSFDEFGSYAERGKKFKSIVNNFGGRNAKNQKK